jgi:hypothetical protein
LAAMEAQQNPQTLVQSALLPAHTVEVCVSALRHEIQQQHEIPTAFAAAGGCQQSAPPQAQQWLSCSCVNAPGSKWAWLVGSQLRMLPAAMHTPCWSNRPVNARPPKSQGTPARQLQRGLATAARQPQCANASAHGGLAATELHCLLCTRALQCSEALPQHPQMHNACRSKGRAQGQCHPTASALQKLLLRQQDHTRTGRGGGGANRMRVCARGSKDGTLMAQRAGPGPRPHAALHGHRQKSEAPHRHGAASTTQGVQKCHRDNGRTQQCSRSSNSSSTLVPL